MLPEPGTWPARVVGHPSVYETEAGALMCAIEFEVENTDAKITAYQCLASKAGEVQQLTVRNLREAFGWDGGDPFWLCDTDLSDRQVEIVVELEPDNRDGTMRPRVKWINAPGRSGAMPPQGDRKTILAKYGSKFRALAGGTPVKPAAAAAKPAGKAPAKPAAAPQAKPAPAPAGSPLPESSMDAAWELFCRNAPADTDDGDLTSAWYRCVPAITGKTQEACTPADWGKALPVIPGWVALNMPKQK